MSARKESSPLDAVCPVCGKRRALLHGSTQQLPRNDQGAIMQRCNRCASYARPVVRRTYPETGTSFVAPDGTCYPLEEIPCFKTFCQRHQLRNDSMSLLKAGSIFSHQGWKRSPAPTRSAPDGSFVAPDGTLYPLESLDFLAFCEEHALPVKEMQCLARGQRRSYHGWRFKHREECQQDA